MTETTLTPGRQLSGSNPTKPLIDISVVLTVSAIAFVLEDLANSRGWLTIGPEARGVTPVLGGALAAVAVVFARGGSLADLGFRQPRRWILVPFQIAAILIAFIAGELLVPKLVGLFTSLPEPDLSRYDALAGNLRAAITMALLLPLTASIPEEIIYRGFLIRRLTDLFGNSAVGVVLSILVQALLFSAVHFMWGVGGMIVALVMGVVWGTAFLLCGRNLWPLILAHSTGHILGVFQLYLGARIDG